MTDSMDPMEALIAKTLKARNEARAKEGKPPYTEQEVKDIREKINAALNDENAHKVADLLKQGGAQDFQHMAVLNGIAGATALINSIINWCPGLAENRRKVYRKSVVCPDGVKLDSHGRGSGMRLDVPAAFNTAGKKVHPAQTFMLHCGPVPDDYSVDAEFEKLKELLSADDLMKVLEQGGWLLEHARQAYAQMLGLNLELMEKLKRKMGEEVADKFRPTVIMTDPHQRTHFLEYEGQKLTPQIGLMVTPFDFAQV